MPRSPKYPLESLRKHRECQASSALGRFGDAIREREAASLAKSLAQKAHLEVQSRARAVRRAEACRLGKGELRAGDLVRAQAWEDAVMLEFSDRLRDVHQAEAQLMRARGAEEEARAVWLQKKADRDVLAKDEDRFETSAHRANEASADDAAEEAFAARWSQR